MKAIEGRLRKLETAAKAGADGVAVIVQQLGETAAAAFSRHIAAKPEDASRGLRVFIQRFSA